MPRSWANRARAPGTPIVSHCALIPSRCELIVTPN
jgi:hypothetical protein